MVPVRQQLTVWTGQELGVQVRLSERDPQRDAFPPIATVQGGYRPRALFYNQPHGGMWTCRPRPGVVSAVHDWLEPETAWVPPITPGMPWWTLTPRPDARVLVLDGEGVEAVFARFPYCGTAPLAADTRLNDVRARNLAHGAPWLDFEAIAAAGFAGVHFTGAIERVPPVWRLALMSWAHECTLWLRWAFVEDAAERIPTACGELVGYEPDRPESAGYVHMLRRPKRGWVETAPIRDEATHAHVTTRWRRLAAVIEEPGTSLRHADAARLELAALVLDHLVTGHNLIVQGEGADPMLLPVGAGLFAAATEAAPATVYTAPFGWVVHAIFQAWCDDYLARRRAPPSVLPDDAGITEIMPGLYQSGALPAVTVAQHGIDAIIDCTLPLENPHKPPPGVECIRFPFVDGPGMPDSDALHALVGRVVELVRSGRRVLVHCYLGLNRSGLVNALILRELEGIDGAEAIQRIRDCRGAGALSNRVFVQHLAALPAPAAAGVA